MSGKAWFRLFFWLSLPVWVILFFVNTHMGAQLLFSTLRLKVPGQLHADSMHGSLLSGITFSNLRYQNQNTQGEIQTLHLALKGTALWRLHLSLKTLTLKNIQWKQSDRQLTLPSLSVKGEVFPKHLTLNWPQFTWQDRESLAGKKGHLALTPKTWHLNQSFEKARCTLDAAHTEKGWRLQTHACQLPGYVRHLQGHAFIGQRSQEAELTFKGLKPAPWLPFYKGNLSGKLLYKAQSKRFFKRAEHSLMLENLSGTLNHAPLQGHLRLKQRSQGPLLDAKLQWGQAHLKAQGSLMQGYQWHLKAPNLNFLSHLLKGALTFNGHYSQKALQADLKLQQFSMGNLFIASLQSSAHLFFSPKLKSFASLTLDHLSLKHPLLTTLNLHATGTLKRHQIRCATTFAKKQISSTLKGQWDGKTWRGETRNLTVTNEQKQTYTFHQATVNFAPQADYFALNLQATPQEKLILEAHPIHALFLETHPLNTTLKLDLNGFEPAPLFSQKIRGLQGHWVGDYQLRGTLFTPSISGTTTFTQGAFELPKLGLRVEDIDLESTLTEAQALTLQAHAHINEHPLSLSIEGEHLLTPKNPNRMMKGHLKGDAIDLALSPKQSLTASFDLPFSLIADRFYLHGNIDVSKADWRFEKKHKHKETGLTEDIVFYQSGDPLPNVSTYNVSAKVNLKLSPDVLLHYKGLNTHLTGAVNLQLNPTHPLRAKGTLSMQNGTYHAYGQRFQIRHGILTFHDTSLKNPSINLEAVKKIHVAQQLTTTPLNAQSMSQSPVFLSQLNELTLGVRLQNTLKNPLFNLFSEPAGLSEADILSYLLTGQPAALASDTDQAHLLSVASNLNLGKLKMASLTEQLKETFGLDEITFETRKSSRPHEDPFDNTSLVLGKYLTPELYLNYHIGLRDTTLNTLQANYQLGQHWTLQGSMNREHHAIDFFYNINRD